MASGTKSLDLGPKSLLTSLHMIRTTEDWERLVCPDTWCVAVFLCIHFGLNIPHQSSPFTARQSILHFIFILLSLKTTSFQVVFGLPLGLTLSTSQCLHFFTHSLSSFHNTWRYNTAVISSSPSISLTLTSICTSTLAFASLAWIMLTHVPLNRPRFTIV